MEDGESKIINKKLVYGGFFLTLILCSVLGYFWGLNVQEKRYADFLSGFKNIREGSDKYSLINPLIGGISPQATDVGIFTEIKEDIFLYLQNEEKLGNLYNYSFFFRDLNTGLWFGSNESFDLFPASLFKLPIAIAAYKQSETEQGFLDYKILYTQEVAQINESVETNSKSTLVVGESYSVRDLIKLMITESDNGAKDLILSVLDKKYLNNLFSIVSLVDIDSAQTYQISSRKYALFLRILYGSSYINEENSEAILRLLTSTTFKKGLVAGIPFNVPVAHKYGTYNFEEMINGVIKPVFQLHDCGIVYHATNPYVFCLMTKGKDIESLYKIISTTSEKIYKNQESGNRD